ncbi:hypothetical protein WJ54_36115 [Burkholderia ubonensis]|nr:hypothetical protein WJ54_36115 [Burkholderia ubonensis]
MRAAAPGLPLIAPLVIPPTPRECPKFAVDGGVADDAPASCAGGYSVRGTRGLVRWVVVSLPEKLEDLTGAKRRQLAQLSPQAFRHTFSTLSAATDVPLDVVQQLLDHASLQATSVSVTAERKRRRRELAKYYARLAGEN